MIVKYVLLLTLMANPSGGVAIPPPDGNLSEQEIVVLGKLNVAKIRFNVRKNGSLNCKVVKRTKERQIDALACAAVRNCHAQARAVDKALLACIPTERVRLVRSYVAQQRGTMKDESAS